VVTGSDEWVSRETVGASAARASEVVASAAPEARGSEKLAAAEVEID